MATTLAQTAPRNNVWAAPAPRRTPGWTPPVPVPTPRGRLPVRPPVTGRIAPMTPAVPVVSSMDLPNRAGQGGPVPMKGIVNSMMLKRTQ